MQPLLEEVGLVDISLVGVMALKWEEVVEEVVTVKAVPLEQLGKVMLAEQVGMGVRDPVLMLVEVVVVLVQSGEILSRQHL